MVGAAPHDLRHVLRLLIDGHGTNTGTEWGWGAGPQLHGAGLCQLAKHLVEGRGVL